MRPRVLICTRIKELSHRLAYVRVLTVPVEQNEKTMRDSEGRIAVIRPKRWRANGGGKAPADLEALYRESFQMVYTYAYYRLLDPALAEDLTSVAFTKAIENFDRFDPSRAKFSTWVISIARNAITDHYRKNRVITSLDDVGAREPAREDEYPALDENAKEVARLLSFISEEYRELVFLKYYEGKRNTEIAELLGMNPSTVATRLKRALDTMRAHAQKSS